MQVQTFHIYLTILLRCDLVIFCKLGLVIVYTILSFLLNWISFLLWCDFHIVNAFLDEFLSCSWIFNSKNLQSCISHYPATHMGHSRHQLKLLHRQIPTVPTHSDSLGKWMNLLWVRGIIVLDVGYEFRDQGSIPGECHLSRDVDLEQVNFTIALFWWPPPRLATCYCMLLRRSPLT